MTSPESNELEALMRAHGPFLRRLARALASDADAAEDLVSDTWVAALRPGLGRLKNERGWLATVLRRRAATIRAQPTAIPIEDEDRQPGRESSPDEALVRLEREQLVNGALARLQEPYRSVLFLRYHDGLSAGVIAKRKSASHKTVRTQISRGLEHLRRHLDQEMTRRGATDPRTQWLSALIPLGATPSTPAAASLAATLAMKKVVALVVTALLLAVAGIWAVTPPGSLSSKDATAESAALRGQDRGAQLTGALAGAADLKPANDPSESLPMLAKTDPKSSMRQELSATESRDEEGTEETPSLKRLGVAGTVVVLDDSSTPPSSLDGTLKIYARDEQSGTYMSFPVIDGSFRAEFEAGDEGQLRLVGSKESVSKDVKSLTFAFSQPEFPALGPTLRVDANGAFSAVDDIQFPFGTEDAVVYVKSAPTTRLTVVDKATRAELVQVKVLGLSSYTSDAIHPAGFHPTALTKETSSPVTLAPPASFLQRGEVDALVGAEGYGWESVRLDLREGADRRVELERGARLAVTITGEVPRTARLRLYGEEQDGQPLSEVRAEAQKETVWEALAPGSYDIRVEIGEWYKNTMTLAEAHVILEPDGSTALELDAKRLEQAPRAVASGVLVIPTIWSLKSPRARVEMLGLSSDGSDQTTSLQDGDFEPVEGLPGTYAFELPAMEVGKYEFELNSLAWKSIFDLPSGGTSALRFELPEPVLISVQVIDADTKAPVPVESISWHPQWPRGAQGGPVCSAGEPLSTGLFRFNVTRGPIQISSWGEGFNAVSKTIDAQGMEEFFLETRRSPRATVSLVDGDTQVPWPDRHEIVIEPVGATQGQLSASGTNRSGKFFRVSEPGRYQLVVPDLNGFHSQAPVEFDMVAGENTEIVIRLMPK